MTAKVVVCGTAFGRIYLRAVAASPSADLAGVLSRGSAASRACADEYGVPCYTDPAQLPPDIDTACVVVRAGVAGGDGADLARRLLACGVHVLQEHPLHQDELAACLRTAREHRTAYRVNAFYPHLPPVRRFLAAAAAVRDRQRPLFVDAVCGGQVLYPLLDVLARAVGGPRPWYFSDPGQVPPELAALADTVPPYTSVSGVLGGVPLALRVQNQISPADPDNHALLLHRVTIGFEGGVLALADTHGPVLWSPRLHSHRDHEGRLVLTGPGTERLDVPATELLTDTPPRLRTVLDEMWPAAARQALEEFLDERADPAAGSRAGQWALTVTRLWQDLTGRLGPPELISPSQPEPIDVAGLLAGHAPVRR